MNQDRLLTKADRSLYRQTMQGVSLPALLSASLDGLTVTDETFG